jgi:RimJ/RimL family protein N-acetyltransferase
LTLEVRGDAHAHLVVATGAGVRIRRKVREDAADEFAWRTSEENARYDGSAPFGEDFDRFLHQFEYDLRFSAPQKGVFALDADDGEHIGSIMWYRADAVAGTAEFGISIGREEYRDRGLGTKATIAFLRYLWETTSFRVIYLHTLEWNDRARASFRAAGFDDVVRVLRDGEPFMRMEARREWWLLWDAEGRFRADAPDNNLAREGRLASE